jgi:light-regulated signal transduction histidine kinase (bacteriophytochrome)
MTKQSLYKSRGTSDVGELEDVVYILSHDVRGSVRGLLELPQWIKEDLVEQGYEITGSLAQCFVLMIPHMSRLDRMLIDLLEYSRVGRKQSMRTIDLETAVDSVPKNGTFHSVS